MAKVFSFSPIYAVLFVFLIVIASTEIEMVEGNHHKLCKKECHKCQGDCRNKEDCKNHCIEYEYAKSGDCDGSVCYCYVECDD